VVRKIVLTLYYILKKRFSLILRSVFVANNTAYYIYGNVLWRYVNLFAYQFDYVYSKIN